MFDKDKSFQFTGINTFPFPDWFKEILNNDSSVRLSTERHIGGTSKLIIRNKEVPIYSWVVLREDGSVESISSYDYVGELLDIIKESSFNKEIADAGYRLGEIIQNVRNQIN